METRPYPIPEDEAARLVALHAYAILDTAPEEGYDDMALLAAQICGTPVALVTLIDQDRQWFKAKVGTPVEETSRDVAFCAYTICQRDVLVVADALMDERFAGNPLVASDPHIRFYAGAPLLSPGGHALGSVCVLDFKPHQLGEEQIGALRALARQVVALLELRRLARSPARTV